MSHDNKRKYELDNDNTEQNKKIYVKINKNEGENNNKVPKLSNDGFEIKSICEKAKLFNDESLTNQGKVIIICDDAAILETKAGDLLWKRSLHVIYPPLNTDTYLKFEMPIKDKHMDKTYTFVTMTNALRLRVDMAKCAKIDNDYSSTHLLHKETINEETDPDDWLEHYEIMIDKFINDGK
jgi:hypothetical protein